MTKNILTIVLAILLFVTVIFGYPKYADYKERLAATAGNGLFHVLTHYGSVYENYNSDSDLTLEEINQSEQRLETVHVLSKNLDLAIGHELLEPIAENFLTVITMIESEHNDDPQLSQFHFEQLIEMIEELEHIIENTYYLESRHGGEADINTSNFDNVETFKEKLDDYISEYFPQE